MEKVGLGHAVEKGGVWGVGGGGRGGGERTRGSSTHVHWPSVLRSSRRRMFCPPAVPASTSSTSSSTDACGSGRDPAVLLLLLLEGAGLLAVATVLPLPKPLPLLFVLPLLLMSRLPRMALLTPVLPSCVSNSKPSNFAGRYASGFLRHGLRPYRSRTASASSSVISIS